VLTPESKQFEKIVDSTITFIQKFARAITLLDKRIQWLHFRGADGLFHVRFSTIRSVRIFELSIAVRASLLRWHVQTPEEEFYVFLRLADGDIEEALLTLKHLLQMRLPRSQKRADYSYSRVHSSIVI